MDLPSDWSETDGLAACPLPRAPNSVYSSMPVFAALTAQLGNVHLPIRDVHLPAL